nr:hypothetical protein GCM10020092_062750 [Actinoplanes digitatis]
MAATPVIRTCRRNCNVCQARKINEKVTPQRPTIAEALDSDIDAPNLDNGFNPGNSYLSSAIPLAPAGAHVGERQQVSVLRTVDTYAHTRGANLAADRLLSTAR